MSTFGKRTTGWRGETGLGLMEVIVGVLVALIVGSILLHLVRLGVAMYTLSAATDGVTQQLEVARNQAVERRTSVSVFFDAKEKKFGVDRNGNGRLDNPEADELPAGVEITEDAVVTFARSGNLAPGSKQPHIVISNSRNSRRVSISQSGAIEVD